MRRCLFLVAFVPAHVLALLGPLVLVRMISPRPHLPPTTATPAPPARPDLSGVPHERLRERAELRSTWQILAIELAWLTYTPTTLDPTKPRTPDDEWRDHKTKLILIQAASAELNRRFPAEAASALDVDLDIAYLRRDIERMLVELNELPSKGR
jgi:hypothetical protein